MSCFMFSPSFSPNPPDPQCPLPTVWHQKSKHLSHNDEFSTAHIFTQVIIFTDSRLSNLFLVPQTLTYSLSVSSHTGPKARCELTRARTDRQCSMATQTHPKISQIPIVHSPLSSLHHMPCIV
eukprot:sb/3475854/